MSIEWRGAPTRIFESARAATWYGYRTGTEEVELLRSAQNQKS